MIVLNLLFFTAFISSMAYWLWLHRAHSQWINAIFFQMEKEVIGDKKGAKEELFYTKLLQAGLTYKDIKEFFMVTCLAASALVFLVWTMHFSFLVNVALIIVAVLIPLAVPFLYIEEQINARKKRIETDLAVFLDLVVIILEGGGGLNNAIDEVTSSSSSVIGHDLLDEMRLFKNELINYSSDIAYDNLVRRTGSEMIASLVGFLKLSEETGIGVKNVFENQAQEIKNKEIFQIDKKAAMMNVYLTFTMFLFMLPAIIAMMALPLTQMKLFPNM